MKGKITAKTLQSLVMLALSVFLLAECNASPKKEGLSYRQVDMQEATKMMEEEKDYVILDVRTKEEYIEKHIPGAILIPNETIGDNPPKELPQKEQLIMVYCRSGNRSKQASQKLVSMRYSNVVEFGGIKDWPGEVKNGEEP